TKAISIINDGVGEAGALVSGGANGINVNAGTSDAVSLRGLTIKGIGFGGGNGIVFTTGKSLTIENCVVRDHVDNGGFIVGEIPNGNAIVFRPSGSSMLAVSRTLVADNEHHGVLVVPTGSGTVMA